MRIAKWAAGLTLVAAATTACSNGAARTSTGLSTATRPSQRSAPASRTPTTPAAARPVSHPDGLPGMPPVVDPRDIYAADRPAALSPVVAGFRPLLYVPNSESSSVDEIDPITHKIVRHILVGRNPQHVAPSWDLKTLWVLNDLGNTVTAIDPRDGTPGRTFPVKDPYNMYFTPDGRYALVVEEARQVLAFRDPHTMSLARKVPVR